MNNLKSDEYNENTILTSSKEIDYPDIDLLPENKTSRDTEMFFFQDKKYTYSALVNILESEEKGGFLPSFKKDNEYHYFEKIKQLMTDQKMTLVIDFNDIFESQHSMKNGVLLYELVKENPKLFLKACRKAAFNILLKVAYDYAIEIREFFRVVLSNAITFKKEITDIVNVDVGHLVYTENFVVSIASQKNYTKSMAWSCGNCGRLTYKESIGFRLPRLTQCMYCESKDIRESWKDAITDTMQEIKLQQKFERIVSGRVPKTIMGVIYGQDMINPVQAGDICAVTGIVDLTPNSTPSENAIAEYILEILWIEKKSDELLTEIDPELEEKVKGFIDPENEDEGYQNLIESIAPSVMGHEILKEVLLLQMVGSEVAYFQDNSRHRGEINILLVGDAGCLAAGTKVILGNGKIVNIEELGKEHLQDINVKMLIGNGMKTDTATVFHKYDNKKVIELITETGKSIKGTYNHPLETWNPIKREYEWTRLDEMKVGDKLKTIQRITTSFWNPIKTNFDVSKVYKFGHKYKGIVPEYVDHKLASFMGYIIGDGWVRTDGYRIGFCVSEKEIEILPQLLEFGKIFGIEAKIETRGYYKPEITYMIDGRTVTRSMTMTYVEYNSKAMVSMLSFLAEKRVPDLIFKSGDIIVSKFLKWLFQADGYVINNGRGRNGINLTAKNIELLRDVQLLLLKFGIHSRIVQGKSRAPILYIRRGESIIKFAKDIGFADSNKNRILGELTKNAEIFKHRGKQTLEKITKIIYHEKPETVYDIEVPKTHRFVANSIVSHNTAKSKLARFVYQCYARAVYVSGKTTEAGITATVVLGKNSNPILEAGAYLLASSEYGALVVCDEMEKTKKEAREAIAGCTDDNGMVEIHKSTIHQSIPINNASLHIANPKTGESWDPEQTIKDNTGFETWYLSRFLTFIVRDLVDKELDTSKAKHYLEQFGNTKRQYKLNDINDEIRRKQKLAYGDNTNIKSASELAFFNAFVRREFKPELDPRSKAAKKLQQFYISVRPMQAGKSARVTIRALGDLVRLSEASARAHMRNEVTEKDADIAIKILQASIASSGFNTLTGEYDQQALEEQKKKKFDGEAPVGFFTASELLKDKTARELISVDLKRMAEKRQNRFYRDVANKLKTVLKVIKHYALMSCRDCKGEGRLNDGYKSTCYQCQGQGGLVYPFQLSDIDYQCVNRGLSQKDIQEIVQNLIRKKVIVPKYNDSSTFEINAVDDNNKKIKSYRKALLKLASVEAQIAVTFDIEEEEEKSKIKDPEMIDRINKVRNLMPSSLRDNVRKKLNQVDNEE